MFDEKQLLIAENQKRLAHFFLSDEEHYQHHLSSKIPTRLFSGETVYYHKERLNIGDSTIDVIKKNGEFSHFIWNTSPNNLAKAQEAGLIHFDALTSQVLAASGNYKKEVYYRAYKDGIVSNKYQQKMVLLDFFQHRVKALQTLERLINDFDYSLSPEENKLRLKFCLNQYKKSIDDITTEAIPKLEPLKLYDRDVLTDIQHYLAKDLKHADSFIESLTDTNLAFKAFGSQSLQCFIKSRMISALRQTQGINQNISYSRGAKSLLRGELNSSLEDTFRIINDYKPSLNNQVLRAHQGDFSNKKKISIDFSFLGENHLTIEQSLMAISLIDKADKITHIGGNKYTLQAEQGESHSLKTTRFTKWLVNDKPHYVLLRSSLWCWNVFIGLVVGLSYDLFVGLLSGLSGHKISSLASKMQINLQPKTQKNTAYQGLVKKIHHTPYSLGTLIGFKLSNLARNLAWDLFHGTRTSVQHFKLELWENLRADYRIGKAKNVEPQEVLARLDGVLNQLKVEKKASFESLIDKAPTQFKNFVKPQINSSFPLTPYPLNQDEWLDIGNQAVNGVRTVCDTLIYPIHSKHPFTGLIFTTSYIVGGLVILAPKTMSFLPKTYIDLCNTIGAAMSKSHYAKAISSGMTQAQLYSGSFEALLHGHNSWFASGGKLFERNPSNTLVYITMAVGLGALVAFKLNIPIISEMLRNDMGNIPIPALGFAGAKIGFLLVHLLEEKKEAEEKLSKQSLRRELSAILQKLLEPQKLSKEEQNSQIETTVEYLLSDDFLKKISSHIKEVKMNASSYELLQVERASFLMRLEQEKELLVKLPHQLKRELLIVAKNHLHFDAESLKCINRLLFPAPPQSIFIVTLTTAFDYIPLLFRNLTMVVTHCRAPFEDLKEKFHKDIARIANIFSSISHALASYLRIFARNIADIIANEIVARAEGFIRGDRHAISRINYHASETIDCSYEKSRQLLGSPTDKLKTHVNHTASAHLCKKATRELLHQQTSLWQLSRAPSSHSNTSPEIKFNLDTSA